MPTRYAALILVGAYAGLRWGEAVGLRRRDIDMTRSRIRVSHTAVEVGGRITLDNLPKTTRSIRSVPVARSVMRRLQDHLDNFVGPSGDDLVFAAAGGGPLFRSFSRTILRPAVTAHRIRHLGFTMLRSELP